MKDAYKEGMLEGIVCCTHIMKRAIITAVEVKDIDPEVIVHTISRLLERELEQIQPTLFFRLLKRNLK